MLGSGDQRHIARRSHALQRVGYEDVTHDAVEDRDGIADTEPVREERRIRPHLEDVVNDLAEVQQRAFISDAGDGAELR